jgi:hypothetical protein
MQSFRAFLIPCLSAGAALAQLGSVQNNAPNTPGPSLEQAKPNFFLPIPSNPLN